MQQANGALEVEFQNQQARQLRVTENPTPAAAPKGFTALEPVSYIVELGGGAAAAQGLTLSKIDYIRNANSEPNLVYSYSSPSFQAMSAIPYRSSLSRHNYTLTLSPLAFPPPTSPTQAPLPRYLPSQQH